MPAPRSNGKSAATRKPPTQTVAQTRTTKAAASQQVSLKRTESNEMNYSFDYYSYEPAPSNYNAQQSYQPGRYVEAHFSGKITNNVTVSGSQKEMASRTFKNCIKEAQLQTTAQPAIRSEPMQRTQRNNSSRAQNNDYYNGNNAYYNGNNAYYNGNNAHYNGNNNYY